MVCNYNGLSKPNFGKVFVFSISIEIACVNAIKIYQFGVQYNS